MQVWMDLYGVRARLGETPLQCARFADESIRLGRSRLKEASVIESVPPGSSVVTPLRGA